MIIEENDTLNYEEFKQDYINKKISVQEIRDKYHLGMSRYKNLAREVREETGAYRSNKSNKNPKYYCRRKNSFIIQKRLNGECISFGQYKNETTTKKMVELLKGSDWDRTRVLEFKEKLRDEGYEF